MATYSKVLRRTFAPRIDRIYYSGAGRTFKSWIDTVDGSDRADENGSAIDPGYDATDLIENPVYIIEDILRTEAGLDPSTDGADIDLESFDLTGANDSGGADEGLISITLGADVADIKYAFCVDRFTSGISLCQRIAATFGGILTYNHAGKVVFKVRLRAASYGTTVDATIPYFDVGEIEVGRTPLSSVRNSITVKYLYDYATDAYLAETDPTNDAAAPASTSQGTGANGIGVKREMVCELPFVLDEATAEGYRDYLLDVLAYQRITLAFHLPPQYLYLEIGDTIAFSDWPADFKLYGNTIGSTDIFMITKISKGIVGAHIECLQVSEVTD